MWASGDRGFRGRPSVRLAAIIVTVALAAGSLVLFGRGGPASTPSVTVAPSGTVGQNSTATPAAAQAAWVWDHVAGTIPAPVAAVPGGFLGECVAAGRPAACTSVDGVMWTTRIASRVLAVGGESAFTGWSVATSAGVWVASDTIDAGSWRSSDGTVWTPVDAGIVGLKRAHVQALDHGFAMVAATWDGSTDATPLFLSDDGSRWRQATMPAGATTVILAGAIGLVAVKSGGDGSTASFVTSRDGSDWRQLSLPDGATAPSSTIRLSGGGYLGLSKRAITPFASGTLVASADGYVWSAGDSPMASVDSMAMVGGRVLAIGRIVGSSLRGLFETTDAVTWWRVAVLDGHDLTATGVVAMGDRAGLLVGSRLTMVGRRLDDGSVAATPTSARPTSANRSPSGVVVQLDLGDWRWHQLEGSPDLVSGIAVKVPNGYFARCGGSMCTSSNGWTWRTPADASIFSADETALFTPRAVAHGSGSRAVVLSGEGIWYTTDGVHWQLSAVPASSREPRAVLPADGGFVLVGDDGNGNSPLYSSPDGDSWTPAGTVPLIGGLADGDMAGGMLSQTLSTSKGTVGFVYSSDGRSWVNADLPATEAALYPVYRLPGGSLVTCGAQSSILASTDGRTWRPLPTPFAVSGFAVAGGRILALAGGDGAGMVWESTDGGASFHRLVAGVSELGQLGDLVTATTTAATLVGSPLTDVTSPGATPSVGRLPSGSPAPTASPTTAPSDGISRAEAVRIAAAVLHLTPAQAAKAAAGPAEDYQYGRWVWNVSITLSYQGPLSAEGLAVAIDYFTGEILDFHPWIS